MDKDLQTIREFLEAELEQRQTSGQPRSPYVVAAFKALAALRRVEIKVQEERINYVD